MRQSDTYKTINMGRAVEKRRTRRKSPSAVSETVFKHPFLVRAYLTQRLLRGYHLLQVIGKGSYGIVYKARKNGGESTVALKMVNLRETDPDDFELETEVSRLCSEEGIGPKLLDGFALRSAEIGVLVFDLWDITLGGYMDSSGRKTVPKAVSKKVQNHLKRLRDMKMGHFDLHEENILLRVSSKGEIKDAVLSDFGKARHTCAVDHETHTDAVTFFELPRTTTVENFDQKMWAKVQREWQ